MYALDNARNAVLRGERRRCAAIGYVSKVWAIFCTYIYGLSTEPRYNGFKFYGIS